MVTSKDELRAFIYQNLELVKELLLTRNDLALITFISEKKEVSPTQVAEFKNANVNNASTKLKKLFEQGYLNRREGCNQSGGIEYLYSLSECLK